MPINEHEILLRAYQEAIRGAIHKLRNVCEEKTGQDVADRQKGDTSSIDAAYAEMQEAKQQLKDYCTVHGITWDYRGEVRMPKTSKIRAVP